MRRVCIAAFLIIASGALTFFMEPLIPLGDWKWLVIAIMGFLIAWWLTATDSQRIPSVSAVKEHSDSGFLHAVSYLGVYALSILTLPLIVLCVVAVIRWIGLLMQ